LRTWDIAERRENAAPITLPGAPGGNPALSPDLTRIAVPIRGGPLAIYDAHARQQIASLRIDDSPAASASFSHDGRILVAASTKGAVRLYATRDLRSLSPVLPAGARASVDLSPDNRTLVTTDADGRIQLWDLATHRPVGPGIEGPQHVSAIARFTPDGAYVYAVYANGLANRWDVRLASWTRRACSIAGRRLTRREWQDVLPDRPYHPAC
jgi:WD40 repeat protein